MKLIKKIIILSIILCSFFPSFGLADDVTIENPLEYDTFKELFEAIAKFFFIIAITITPIMILIGAFYFLTAGGDPAKVELGKKIILYTCLGLAIVLFAWGLIAFIQQILGVE